MSCGGDKCAKTEPKTKECLYGSGSKRKKSLFGFSNGGSNGNLVFGDDYNQIEEVPYKG